MGPERCPPGAGSGVGVGGEPVPGHRGRTAAFSPRTARTRISQEGSGAGAKAADVCFRRVCSDAISAHSTGRRARGDQLWPAWGEGAVRLRALHTGGSQTPLPPCRRVCSLSTEGRGSGGACSGLRRAKSQNASGDLPPAITTIRSGCRLHHHHLSALLPPGNSERGCGRAGRQLAPQRGEGASWPGGERAGSQPQRHGGG